MPSSHDNFEDARSRSWDIVAAATGIGIVGIGLSMGYNRYFKPHKTDRARVNQPSGSTSSSAPNHNLGAAAAYHDTYRGLNYKVGSQIKGLAPKNKFQGFVQNSEPNFTTNYMTASINSRPDLTISKTILPTSGVTEYSYVDGNVRKKLSWNLSVGRDSIGNIAALQGQSARAYIAGRKVGNVNLGSLLGGMKIPQFNRVVNAGEQLGVLPTLLFPAGGGRIKEVDPLDLFKRSMEVLNSSKDLSPRLTNYYKQKGLSPVKVGERLKSFVSSIVQLPAYTDVPSVRELTRAVVPMDIINEHQDLLEFWLNSDLVSQKGIQTHEFSSLLSNKVLTNKEGYLHYVGVSNKDERLAMTSNAGRVREQLAKLGYHYGYLKEEDPLKGMVSTIPLSSIPMAPTAKLGQRLNEAFHARPFAPGAAELIDKARRAGSGIFSGEVLTNPVRLGMRLDHTIALSKRGLKAGADKLLDVAVTGIAAMEFNPHSPLAGGSILFGTGSKELNEALRSKNYGTLTIPFPTTATKGEFLAKLEGSTFGEDIYKAVKSKLTPAEDAAVKTGGSYKSMIESFLSGTDDRFQGLTGVRLGVNDFIQKVVDDTEVSYQFDKDINVTGARMTSGGLELDFLAERELTSPGTPLSVGGNRAHVSVQGAIPAPMLKGINDESYKILKNNKLSVIGVTHSKHYKEYDWARYNLTQYLGLPTAWGDTAKAAERVKNLKDLFSKNKILISDATLHDASVRNGFGGVQFQHLGSGEKLADLFDAMRKEQIEYIASKQGISEAEAAKLFPIMTNREADQLASLTDVGDSKMIINYLETFENKKGDIAETTGFGRAGSIGDRHSQKISVEHMVALRRQGANNVADYLEKSVLSQSRASAWPAMFVASLGGNLPDEFAGDIEKFVRHHMGDANVATLKDFADIPVAEFHKAMSRTSLSPSEVAQLPNISRLFGEGAGNRSRGFVIDLGEGLEDEIAEQMRILPEAGSTVADMPRKIVLPPLGMLQPTGTSPSYDTHIGEVNRRQLALQLQIAESNKLLRSIPDAKVKFLAAQEQAALISKAFSEWSSSFYKAAGSKKGFATELFSGIRSGLSGYQNIQPYEYLLDSLSQFKAPGVAHGKYDVPGLYTKDASGALKPIDRRALVLGSLGSIDPATNNKGYVKAKKALASVGIYENVYTFRNGVEEKVGKTGFNYNVAYPELSNANRGVARYVGLDQTITEALGLKFGVSYADPVALFKGHRDTDWDHWAQHFFGKVGSKDSAQINRGIQDDLAKLHANEVKQWEYLDKQRKNVGKGSIFAEIATDVLEHDKVSIGSGTEATFVSTTQKNATGLLTNALEKRMEGFEIALGGVENYDNFLSNLDPTEAGLIRRYLGEGADGHRNLFSMIESTIGTMKQTSISKGFGNVTVVGALERSDQSLLGPNSYEMKIQKDMFGGTIEMALNPDEADFANVLQRRGNSTAAYVADMVQTSLATPQARSLMSEYGFDIPAVEARIAKLREQDAGGKIGSTLKKNWHPIVSADNRLFDQIDTMSAADKQGLASAMESVYEKLQTMHISSGANLQQKNYVKTLYNAIKYGGDDTGKIQSALFDIPDASLTTESASAVRTLSGMNLMDDLILSGSRNEGSLIRAAEEASRSAGNTTLAATPKSGFLYDLKKVGGGVMSFVKSVVNEKDDPIGVFMKGHAGVVDSMMDFGNKYKKGFAIAGGVAATALAAHAVGFLSSESSSMESAPLPPRSMLDDGAMMDTPQYNSSPGPASVTVARDLPSLNSTNMTYSGENMAVSTLNEIGSGSLGSTFIHDDRRSFNRQSMMSYREQQENSRF